MRTYRVQIAKAAEGVTRRNKEEYGGGERTRTADFYVANGLGLRS